MDYIRHHSKCYKGTTEMRMQESMHFMQMHENDDAMYRLVQMSVFTSAYVGLQQMSNCMH